MAVLFADLESCLFVQALLMAEALEKYGSTESVVPSGAFREGDQCDVETYEEIVELGK